MYFDVHGWLMAGLLAMARVAPVFFLLPFFNTSVMTGVVRTPVIILVAHALWPHQADVLLSWGTWRYLELLGREVAIGLLIACVVVWPLWVCHALGSVLDNQRGATLGSIIDPINGAEMTETANLLNLFAAAVFLEGGGLSLMLDTFAASYRLCDPLTGCSPTWPQLFSMLGDLTGKALILASPAVAALLLSEAVLGLLSRFAPQMNAFAVSLTVKSAIAWLILLIYFGPVLPDAIRTLMFRPDVLPAWLIPASS
ncbi:type III secretion system export apparatus subunit SctT [Burkholderia ubonensis]|uniref:type III secretion system export apparatus subunit SctT n=1 Tax=Burkholderia ubonensis TaxID=101571 RepID=UPI0022B76935|nr:type III secretion system export apparatus subunit SctT [Burkholderia ubonensis]